MIPTDVEILAAWRSERLAELVERVLEPVIGEPFMHMGRAADLIWMGFGDKVPAPTLRDPERHVTRHRIHVACPLRVDSEVAVLIASGDIWRPGPGHDPSDPFDPMEKRGTSLFDASREKFFAEHEPGSAVVKQIGADAFGGLQLGLSTGHTIKIFPNECGAQEHWRYFMTGEGHEDEDHFVVVPDWDTEDPEDDTERGLQA